ncbi:hypothetical protein [Tateyamaria omphalii]|nr:hypothetical protein [Tateyamaria omphalii]
MNSIDYNALHCVANGQRLRRAIAARLHAAPVTGLRAQMRVRLHSL